MHKFSLINLIKSSFSVLFMLFLCVNVTAAQAENGDLSLAKKVVKVIHATDQFDNFLPNVAATLKVQLSDKNPGHSDLISKIVDEQTLAVVGERAKLEEAAAKVYAKHFSTAELKAIYEFYDGPVGKKLLSTGAATIGDLLQAFREWGDKVSVEIATKATQILQEKLGKK